MCVWSATIFDLQEEERSLTESIVAQSGWLCDAEVPELSALPAVPAWPVSAVTSPRGVALRVKWLLLS